MTQAPDNTDRKNPISGTPAPARAPAPESREMFSEISSLVAAMAKALGLSEADAAAALEGGEISLGMDRDGNGNPFVAATYKGVTARVYQGAIKRASDGA